jgi:translation initiation factor IF-2
LNKIDRPDANQDYVKKQLADAGLVPDEWEGNTMVVPVSAKQKTGIDDLLEAILLVSESMDIKANPNSNQVIGTIIEAELDHGKGVMATLLVQNGSLEVGDVVLAGKALGKLRGMFDFHGKKIRKAGPSSPVQVMGLSDVPDAGELFQVFASEKEARVVAEERKSQQQLKTSSAPKASLESLFNRIQSGETKELRFIIKADVQGSLEPISTALNDIEKGEVNINILYSETGDIGENDVMLAAASKAVLVGFNVQADTGAKRLAEAEGVSIRLYQIIYRLTEDVEKALKGMLEPEYKETIIGKAEVLAVFKITKLGNIAGCRVTQNEIRRNGRIRVLRNNEKIYEGEISSLKHEKDDVKEVRQGFDCGISIKNFDGFQKGDIFECYTLEKSG